MNGDLVTKYKPVLYLHKEERYFPSSVDRYLANVDVIVDDEVVLESPTQRELYMFSQNDQVNATAAKMVINDDKSSVLFGDSTLQAPCYAFVQNFNAVYVYITYCYFYCYNASYNILGVTDVGAHNADIEHITIEIDAVTGLPTRWYFGAHGHSDGTWHTADELTFEGDHVIGYVARGSHAIYNKPGVVFRLYGTANDKTNVGYKWEPHVVFMNVHAPDPDNSWILYPGRWAPDGIQGVISQQWWNELPATSLNPMIVTNGVWSLLFCTSVVALAAVIFLIGWGIYAAVRKPFGVDEKYPIDGPTLLFAASVYVGWSILVLIATGSINLAVGKSVVGLT